MKNCRDQNQKCYVGELLYAPILIINQITNARVDSGTQTPTVTAANKLSTTTVTGTSEWVTGGVGDSPTARAYFTPSEPGVWEVEVRTASPIVAIERFTVTVI
jgi:hypothetical protein